MLGGDTDKDDLYVAPTIIVDVNNDDVVMQEEVRTYILHIYSYLYSYIFRILFICTVITYIFISS